MTPYRFAQSIALLETSQNPIDFQIGVPGFGLEVDGNVILSLGFDWRFGFGVDLTHGFYFNTSAPASDPELQVFFRASMIWVMLAQVESTSRAPHR